MAKLDKLRELNSDIKDLFDPLTKTLNTNAETVQALQNKTLAALDSNTNASKSLGHHQQSSFLDEWAALLTPTHDSPVTLKEDRGETFAVDNDMIDTLLEMGTQSNKQFQLISTDPNSKKFKIIGVDVFLVPDGIKMKGNKITTKTSKISLNTFDEKRFYVNNIKCYPHDENLYLFKRDLVNKIINIT